MKDECETNTHFCHPDASCTNTGGQYYCTCNDGYEGNGKICNDINECNTGDETCSSKNGFYEGLSFKITAIPKNPARVRMKLGEPSLKEFKFNSFKLVRVLIPMGHTIASATLVSCRENLILETIFFPTILHMQSILL